MQGLGASSFLLLSRVDLNSPWLGFSQSQSRKHRSRVFVQARLGLRAGEAEMAARCLSKWGLRLCCQEEGGRARGAEGPSQHATWPGSCLQALPSLPAGAELHTVGTLWLSNHA